MKKHDLEFGVNENAEDGMQEDIQELDLTESDASEW